MERTRLFVELMNDLHEKLHSNKDYQILKSSEIIRSLLFDTSGPLVDKVNREFSLKITFEHLDTTGEFDVNNPRGPIYSIPGDAFYPLHDGPPINIKVKRSTKEQLLKTPVILSNGTVFNVLQILHYALYKMGGTHHQEGKNEADTLIEEVTKIPYFDFNLILLQIRSIGFVVEDGLLELKNRVMEKYYM